MRKRLIRPVLIAAAAAVLLLGGAAAATTITVPTGFIQITPVTAPTPSLRPVPEPPVFPRTGGPYIGERAALDVAAQSARGPLLKQDVRLMTYRDVVAFTANRTMTIDLDREVYFVVTSAAFVGRHGEPTCASYMTVVDATSGVGFSVICGDAVWPSRLPIAFSH